MFIGIDFGGTNIRGAVIDRNGNVISKSRIKTESQKGYDYIIENLINFINSFVNENKIEGIGIGFPGTVSKQGEIVVAPNLGWENVNLKEILEKKFAIPVIIDNDVNMAICGEKWIGAAKDYSDFFMLTIGTGVGGAFYLNNRFYGGVSNNAGEIGHINLFPEGKICGCGRKGCLEQYASATSLIEYVYENLKKFPESNLSKNDNIEAKHIFDGAKNKDRLSEEAVNYMCENLARGISAVVNLLNPEAVIIGGGVSHAGDYLIEILKKHVKKYSLDYSYKDFSIKLAKLGDEAGIYGAVSKFILS